MLDNKPGTGTHPAELTKSNQLTAWESIARACCRHPIAVLAVWIVLAVAGNVFIPQLESVVKQHTRSFLPPSAASSVAAEKMGRLFHESGSNNLAYIVFEGQTPLSARDHAYYDQLLNKLRTNKAYVQSDLDMWSNPVAAPFSESSDGKSAYVLLRLAGQLGTTQASESIAAVRADIAAMPAPAGLHAYVTGPGATVADELNSIDRQMLVIIIGTVVVVAVLMMLLYRSAITSRIPLLPVAFALAVARPVVALLGARGTVEVSVFSENLLASMTLGAVTNYGIFLVGRYHELRRLHIPPEEALLRAYRSVAPVIVASALTIVFALSSLTFARIGLLRTAGLPCGIALIIGMLASLTLLPALVGAASRRGLAEPRATTTTQRWRRLGTLVARWPIPNLIAGTALLAMLAIPLTMLHVTFAEYKAQLSTTESNRGYQAAERHFPANRLLPEIVSIATDHDLRTPAGLIAIEKVSSKIMQIPGVRAVQSATRPASIPLNEATLTSQVGQIGGQMINGIESATSSIDIGNLSDSLSTAERDISNLQNSMASGAARVHTISDGTGALTDGLQRLDGTIQTVSHYLDPLRKYLAAVPDCAPDSICAQLTKVIDPVDTLLDSAKTLSRGAAGLRDGANAMAGSISAIPNTLGGLERMLGQMREAISNIEKSMTQTRGQLSDLTDYLQGMAQDFRDSGTGGFYVPNRALSDRRYAEVFKLFGSPDGKAMRLLVYSEGEAFGADGARIAAEIHTAAHEATKEGTLTNNEVLTTGVGSAVRDLQADVRHDFILLASVSLLFILSVVLVMLRSLVAAVAVVTTVAMSFASALGLSVLFWTLLLGRELHWAVPPIAFIALVAVGSDYNLLLTSRLKEEWPAGVRTATIRTFAGTGGAVTAAGIVFGLTMFALLRSEILSVAQVGTTVGLGLIIDTLVVRTLVIPAIAGILGEWFWWPLPLLRSKKWHAQSAPPRPVVEEVR
ncbi:RND family transporter [Mycobacterium shigaense]|uniref:MMPL/RND family transporter n=1 Tax=Mycobacterium shigaense TaxID=722731 RepID=UPI002ADFF5D7|nr:RND family transporter [Mycobacterium shigaense]MEA1121406.1 RND family transporter [Mycobacterium shigaense]